MCTKSDSRYSSLVEYLQFVVVILEFSPACVKKELHFRDLTIKNWKKLRSYACGI